MFEIPPKWIFKPIIDNYIDVFWERRYGLTPGLTEFPKFLFNSFFISLSSVALAVLIGMMAAYSFSRFNVKGKDTWLFFILTTRMLPPIAVLIPIYVMYRGLGLINTYVGLIALYVMFNMAFAVWMMKGFFDEIPVEMEEAAMVDGYSRMGAFWKATLPQALTGIAATAVFCLITAWNEFMFAYVLSGFDTRTVPVALARIRGESGINWGTITSMEVIYILPVIIFTFFLQKYLLRGITFGTVRGK
ncbi:TPA: carbohydrate ABC transporter permease [Candidatus Bathyarchaeota archaeon]|nr:carbohydrate ABC transporter permease [Candidatus Bathyarchaeota archaeon]